MAKERVLVIDDEKFFRNLYEDILASEGFEVESADSGMGGVARLKEAPFDLVLIDMVMPDWDGIRTIEEVRKVSPGQEIVMVTHVSEIETAVEAMKAGASDYILKPVKREDLLYAVRKLLKRQKILLENSKLVEENVEYFEILSIYRKCLSILSIVELPRLADAVLEAMVSITGARAGFFWLGREGGWEIMAANVGDEGRRRKLLPTEDPNWRELIETGAPFGWLTGPLHTLYVPLMLDGRRLGIVELVDKKGGRRFGDQDMKFAGIMAEFSQTALNNAEKIASCEDRSLYDVEYGLYTERFFLDALHKQLSLSARYRRPFSVGYLRIDNLASLREDFGAENVRKSLRTIVEKVKGVIRHSDALATRGEGEFFLLFPETDYFGSIMAVKRIEEAVAGFRYVSDGKSSSPVSLLLVTATYPRDGGDAKALLKSLEGRIGELRENVFHSLDLMDRGFWESVGILLERGRALAPSPAAAELGSVTSPYRYAPVDPAFYERVRGLFAEEITLRPFLRGILFVGVETVSPADPFCRKIAAADELAVRVFVVGKKGGEVWDIPNITPVYLKEGETPREMVLFINEEAGYLFLGEEKGAFHTADLYTVEKMISKLRDHYLLQWI